MGGFKVAIGVGSADTSRFEQVEVMAGTGATYTQLPEPFLRHMEITPIDLRTAILAGGQRIKRHIGEAPMRIDGRVFTCPVVFMEEGDHLVLGTVTLNAFGLGVDSVNRRLIPIKLWLPI